MDTADHWMHSRVNGDIGIEVVELFKGKEIKLVTDPSVNTSCMLSVTTGEEWLLFGRIVNGKMTVGRCDYTMRYRESSGQRDWRGFGGVKQLQALRSIYWHILKTLPPEKVLYENGNTEIKQSFKAGLPDGMRKIYYPDGKIYITEEFKDGIRVGIRNFYGPTGQLRSSTKYADGLKTEEIDYQDTVEHAWYLNFQIHNSKKDRLFGESDHDSAYFVRKLDSLRRLPDWAKQIAYIYSYTNGGRSYKRRSYNYLGNLEADTYVDWDKQISEHHLYNKNGKTEMYLKYDQRNDEQVEYDYKEDGTRRDFIRKCESCQFYFGADQPPAGAPEVIYVQ